MTYKRSLLLGLIIPLSVVFACFVWFGIFLFHAWREKDPPTLGGSD